MTKPTKKEALAALRVLQRRFDKASEDAMEAREADAGFDAGEFSGPAHDRADEEFLAPLEYDVEAGHILYDAKEYAPVISYAAGALAREELYRLANAHQKTATDIDNWHMTFRMKR